MYWRSLFGAFYARTFSRELPADDSLGFRDEFRRDGMRRMTRGQLHVTDGVISRSQGSADRSSPQQREVLPQPRIGVAVEPVRPQDGDCAGFGMYNHLQGRVGVPRGFRMLRQSRLQHPNFQVSSFPWIRQPRASHRQACARRFSRHEDADVDSCRCEWTGSFRQHGFDDRVCRFARVSRTDRDRRQRAIPVICPLSHALPHILRVFLPACRAPPFCRTYFIPSFLQRLRG